MDLLHTPFKGTTLFGGELAKLQKANTKCASTLYIVPYSSSALNLLTSPASGRLGEVTILNEDSQIQEKGTGDIIGLLPLLLNRPKMARLP